MKNDTALLLPKEKKSSNAFAPRSFGKLTAKRKWETENWEKGVMVRTFDRRPLPKVKITMEKPNIFRMTEKGSERMDWNNLTDGHRKAFNEAINTFMKRDMVIPELSAGGFSFAYSDDEVDFSAVCIAAEGKLMLFYKELVA